MTAVIENEERPAGVFWRPNARFIVEIALWLEQRPVLEIFAGNGYLAALLAGHGVSVRATSIFAEWDYHASGLYHQVEPLSAQEAVVRYGSEAEVLLICWPTVTKAVLEAVELWGCDRDILYIGEVTDYAKGNLGGCATDEFFDRTYVAYEFALYKGNRMEHAQVRRLKPSTC